MALEKPSDSSGELTLPVREERLTVEKRVKRTLVRATRTVVERFIAVDEDLKSENIVVKHVPIGRVVESVPAVREENGVTIIPVVEEELVLVRRLVLKEELHLERVQSTTHHVETVVLRREEVAVTRTVVSD